MTSKTSKEKRLCFVQNNLLSGEKLLVQRDVCRNLPVGHENEGNYYCILHFPSEEKIDEFNNVFSERINNEEINFRAVWFPSATNLSKRQFKEPADFAFSIFAGKANFNGAIFHHEAWFYNVKFEGNTDFRETQFLQGVDFDEATFRESTSFEKAKFHGDAQFNKSRFYNYVTFESAVFSDNIKFNQTIFENIVQLDSVIFSKKTYFNATKFSKWVNFDSALFDEHSQTFFGKTVFHGHVDFSFSVIKGFVHFEDQIRYEIDDEDIDEKNSFSFEGNNAWLDLQNARIENPQRISFHSIALRPFWFVNQENTKKFVFTNCYWRMAVNEYISARSELKSLRESEYPKFPNPNGLLAKACRQLADNYEESKGFEEASMFRQLAMESKRLGTVWWKQPLTLHWWYWLSSFYGERWKRALGILSGILFIFAIIYARTNFQVCPMDKPLGFSIQQNLCEARTLNFGEAILHSLATATFQNIEYQKPITLLGEIIRILEKIFAPLQAALLALAIRRKFMR